MKIQKRNLATIILAVLCTIALALGVSFLMPKAEKISANAATNAPTLVTGTMSGSFAVGAWMNTPLITNGCAIYESSATRALNSGFYRFSIKITVPAYTEYTVLYPMGVCAGLGIGSGSTSGTVALERYEDNSYSTVLATYGSSMWVVSSSGTYYTDYFTVNNLIYSNDTGSPKDFYAYFCLVATTDAKIASSGVFFGAGFGAATVEATKLPVPSTSDSLTVAYDGNPHTVNFEYAKVQSPKTDLDGNSVSYTSGYKHVTVSVDAVDGNGATTNTYTFVNNGTSATDSEGSGSITATEAGTYTVKFNLSTSAISNGIEWDGGGTAEKKLVFKINKIDPTVNRIVGTGTWYPSNDIYRDISITTSEGDTAGNIVWDAGQNLSVGTNNYTWTFTPADTNNYNTKTGIESITVEGIEITGIRVVFNQGTTKFYTSSSINDLKTRMAVFKVYSDGSEVAVDASDYELDGDISQSGTVTVGVIYTSSATETPAMVDFTGSFDAVITEVNLVSISASFDSTHTVYVSDGLDSLTDYLTVSGISNDGSTVNGITAYTLSTESGGLSVGTVTVKVTYDNDDSITTTFTVEVESDPVLIELNIPEVNDLTYTGETFDVLSEISNLSSTEIATYLDVSGTVSGKLAGEYTVKFKIKDEYIGSVKWENQTATPAGYKLTAKRLTAAQLSADGTTVELKWNINKAKVAAVWDTEKSIWVPASSPLAETTESNFLTQVYTNSDGREFTSIDKLAGGVTYQVTARINPLYASNIELDEGTQSLMDSGDEAYTYTPEYVPTIWERVVQFLKANWLWIVIAVAALILLIIIIAVAVRLRKTKEERAEKKAAEKERKAEEKRRREEEQRRREEERQAQKEKQEAERELAKAKQEAELEKIRAQAGMGMVGAGMAGMAMQQAMPAQPVQQQMPMQQYSQPDSSVLAEIRAELAEIKARQNMGASYSQPPMQMPMQMTMPMPMPQYMPLPQQQGGSYEDARLMLAEERARTAEGRLAEERARAAEEKSYRSMEERAMLAEERYVRGGGAVPALPAPVNQNVQTPAATGATPDFIGAVIASALRNSGVSPAAIIATAQNNAEPQPTVDERSVPGTPTMYPSDAVITTTTTVDTTKAKPVMRTREEDTNFDVDGFYDKFE
ncbi:MAG: hypothetical protein K2J83_06015 [Clostridia bacterium]|nr:hypothetical protein [Clostridia bacterium]